MIGLAVKHFAYLLPWAHQQQTTLNQMLDMPLYRPVIEEGLRTALLGLQANLKPGDTEAERCLGE